MPIVLCDLPDINQVILETRNEWLQEVLELLNISPEIIDLSQTNIDLFRLEMENLGLEIILSQNEEIRVYKKKWYDGKSEESSGWLPPTEDCLIAQWKTPTRVYRKDGRKTYCELRLDEWCSLRMLRKTQ